MQKMEVVSLAQQGQHPHVEGRKLPNLKIL
jgi:hypothetical protein